MKTAHSGAALKIGGQGYPLGELFSDQFTFTIPRYQRAYAWNTDNAGELWDDILGALGEDDAVPIDDVAPYFLGSIVLVKGERQTQADVVDGQQRLTTITLLLAAIRASLPPSKLADEIQRMIYVEASIVHGRESRYRLQVRDRDSEFFETYILKDGGLEALKASDPATLTHSRGNLRNNACLFMDRLGRFSEARKVRLVQYLAQRCYLVAVSTPDLDSAYRIFSVLNQRGMDLSHADIFKSEIIGKMQDGDQESYVKKWEQEEQDLGREWFIELFAHIRMIYGKAKARETLLKEFRDLVLDHYPDGREFIDQVLVPYSNTLERVKKASYVSSEAEEEINRCLGWLNRLDNVDWIPPALTFINAHSRDSQQLLRFLDDLERLAASMFIRRVYINDRLERYGKLLAHLEGGGDPWGEGSPLQLSDEEKRQTFKALDEDIYSQTKTRKYILLRLDSDMASSGAEYEHPIITLEHVLPQTPAQGSQWLTLFPNKADREAWVHRLGNLVLLNRRMNSEAQNYDFEKKKTKYFSGKTIANFALTTSVIQEPEWTPAVLERRQQELLGRLKALWRLA